MCFEHRPPHPRGWPEGGTALKTTRSTRWIHTVIIANFGSPVVLISLAGWRTSTQSGRLSGSQEDRGVSGVKIQLSFLEISPKDVDKDTSLFQSLLSSAPRNPLHVMLYGYGGIR